MKMNIRSKCFITSSAILLKPFKSYVSNPLQSNMTKNLGQRFFFCERLGMESLSKRNNKKTNIQKNKTN